MTHEIRSRVLVQIGPHFFTGSVFSRTFEKVPQYGVDLDCGARIMNAHVVRALREGEGERIVLGDELGGRAA